MRQKGGGTVNKQDLILKRGEGTMIITIFKIREASITTASRIMPSWACEKEGGLPFLYLCILLVHFISTAVNQTGLGPLRKNLFMVNIVLSLVLLLGF